MLGTIARAYVAVLANVAGDHPPGQASPSPISVNVMVGTDARQAGVVGTAATRAAGDDTTDRAQLHGSRRLGAVSPLTLVMLDCRPVDIAMSVVEKVAAVYSPAVLRLQDQPSNSPVRHWRPSVCWVA
jgi:hypothetical protein